MRWLTGFLQDCLESEVPTFRSYVGDETMALPHSDGYHSHVFSFQRINDRLLFDLTNFLVNFRIVFFGILFEDLSLQFRPK